MSTRSRRPSSSSACIDSTLLSTVDGSHSASFARRETFSCSNLQKILHPFIVIMMLASFVALPAFADSALDISAPNRLLEGELLNVSAKGPGSISIYLDDALVARAQSAAMYSRNLGFGDAGIYSFRFESDDPLVSAQSRVIEVVDVPLAISVISPSSPDLSSSFLNISLNTNIRADVCYVLVDGTGHTLSEGPANSYSGSFAVSEGIHSIDYKCKLGDEIAVVSRTIKVDTLPPNIQSTTPAGDVSGAYFTLGVQTDELAMCRFGLEDGLYESLPNSMGSGFTLNPSTVIPISSDGPIAYYIRCEDVYGNAMDSSRIISFTQRISPVATISVNGSKPLVAGTYEVKLTSNVALGSTPRLVYSLPESKSTYSVVLTGKDALWEGYLVLPRGLPDKILTFSFEGISTRGLTGSEINSGATVVIDAQPPSAVSDVTAKSSKDGVLISWKDSPLVNSGADSDIDSYKIYRADHEGVTISNLYATSSSLQFMDAAAKGSRYYYYRVAAVDDAGNIGDLSEEVYGTAVDLNANLSDALPIDPLVETRLDDAESRLLSMMMDANQTILGLSQATNRDEVRVIEEMGLLTQAREILAKLESASASVRSARLSSGDGADAAITDADAAIQSARSALIKKIVPLQSIDLKQPYDSLALEHNLPYAIVGTQLSGSEMKSYLADSEKVQEKSTVSLYAISFRLYDVNGGAKEYTFIKKTIQLDSPLSDAKVIEVIPKTVAEDVSDIKLNGNPTVLEADPVVQYSWQVLEHGEFSYVVERAVPMDDVKKSKSLIYPPVSLEKIALNDNQNDPSDPKSVPFSITGQVTRMNIPFMPDSTDAILVALGIIVIIGLGFYYVKLGSDQDPFKGAPNLPKRLYPMNPKNKGPQGMQPQMQRSQNPSFMQAGSQKIMPQPAKMPMISQPNVVTRSAPAPTMRMGAASSIGLDRGNAISVAASDKNLPKNNSVSEGSAGYLGAAHMTFEKALADAMNSPNSPVLNDAVASSSSVMAVASGDAIMSMLMSAESLIDGKMYPDSLEKYSAALKMLGDDPQSVAPYSMHIDRVYKKLLLHKQLSVAKAAIESKDVVKIRESLMQAQQCAQELGESDTPLLRDAKIAYSDFMKSLNSIEIERTGRY